MKGRNRCPYRNSSLLGYQRHHILESWCAERCANDAFSTSFRATLRLTNGFLTHVKFCFKFKHRVSSIYLFCSYFLVFFFCLHIDYFLSAWPCYLLLMIHFALYYLSVMFFFFLLVRFLFRLILAVCKVGQILQCFFFSIKWKEEQGERRKW